MERVRTQHGPQACADERRQDDRDTGHGKGHHQRPAESSIASVDIREAQGQQNNGVPLRQDGDTKTHSGGHVSAFLQVPESQQDEKARHDVESIAGEVERRRQQHQIRQPFAAGEHAPEELDRGAQEEAHHQREDGSIGGKVEAAGEVWRPENVGRHVRILAEDAPVRDQAVERPGAPLRVDDAVEVVVEEADVRAEVLTENRDAQNPVHGQSARQGEVACQAVCCHFAIVE